MFKNIFTVFKPRKKQLSLFDGFDEITGMVLKRTVQSAVIVIIGIVLAIVIDISYAILAGISFLTWLYLVGGLYYHATRDDIVRYDGVVIRILTTGRKKPKVTGFYLQDENRNVVNVEVKSSFKYSVEQGDIIRVFFLENNVHFSNGVYNVGLPIEMNLLDVSLDPDEDYEEDESLE